MHLFAHSVTAAFPLDDGLVEKVREIINVAVRAENHVAAAPAVSAIRSTFRHKFLSPKTDRAAAATARLRKNFDSIDKHYFAFPLNN
jgi:hypothetical protein